MSSESISEKNSYREYLLAELRTARLRADLWRNQIDAVGCALRCGLISPEKALEVLKPSGFLDDLIVEVPK